MGILDEDIARVRDATDFVQVASQHIALKRVGNRWVGLCPFHAEKTPSFSINAQDHVYYCLAGETRVLTAGGVRPIRELAGTTQRILTRRSVWVDAPFRSFGVQPLMKVTLTRNRQRKEIFATPEHRWILRRGAHTYERTTAELRPGHNLAWIFPRNRAKRLSDLSPFGIAHGIAYGDGTIFCGAVAVDLHGAKDAQLLKWFPHSRTYQLETPEGKPFVKVLHLPLYFKRRPSLDEAPTYLAGWLAGYLAADGHVAKDGTCQLNSADREDLEFVRDVCTRLGIGTYGITHQMRKGKGVEESPLYRIHFINEDLDERYFLIDEHRFRFASSAKKFARRGWVVRSVEPTDRVEEVFCAEVPGTHAFALEDNILTGNCFGCQAKGDVITFVREVEHLDFVGAVERLASLAKIELRYDDVKENKDRQRRSKLFDAMKAAVDWYHQRLLSGDDAKAARGYLRSRGYDGDVVRQFRIGWAPDDWDALSRALKLPEDVLRDTGLGFVNKARKQQDSFRARIMFPIFDPSGKPVAFGGRRLAEGEGPKYKNSPETPIYSKSRTLYGLNWAKAGVVEAGEVIVCEGYTDVIGLFQVGLPRAVATCGTSLADEHFRILKNFARRVVLAYDADAAGQAAAERFYEWEQRYEVDLAVAALPPGSDPGDLARTDPDILRAAVTGAKPFLAFRVDRVLGGANLSTAEGRARAARLAMEAIAEHPSELVRDQYVMEIADRTRIEPDRLREGIATARRRGPAQPSDATTTEPMTRTRPRVKAAGPETEVLRLLIHERDSVADQLHEALFDDDLHAAAYRALISTASLHDAIENADPAAAELLQRLAVEETEASADDVVALLALARSKTIASELEAEGRQSAAPEDYAPILGWLKLVAEDLHPDRDVPTRVDATQRLVAWLAERPQETR